MGGGALRNRFLALRRAQYLALSASTAALTALALNMLSAKAALAEFEIQETEVEKGETEFEYRGAVHWGFPKRESEQAAETGEGESGAFEEEEEGEFLRQSHDLEFQYGLTERWMISTALSADEPLDEDFNLSSVEIELQYEIIAREGNGFGLAFIGAYGFATRGGGADEIEFAPLFELARGNFLFTGNPIFTAQVGEHRETDSLGFEYGWRAEYDFAKHWGIGVEMFGEIEDLSNSGSFEDQPHSIGPTLFFNPGEKDEDSIGQATPQDENESEPAKMEFSLNVGVQFGLTDATSDTALKFQGALAF
jgi:hypothetical protein